MRADWERGTALVPLGTAEATALLRPILPEAEVAAVTPTTGGKANTNLRLDLAGGGPPLLLRFFVRDPASGAKEAAILARLAGRAPVPHLHHFAETNPATGHPYAVLEWIEGPSLEQALAAAGLEDTLALAEQLGTTLAAIGRETFPQNGFLAPDLTVGAPLPPGSAGFLGFVEEMAESAAARGRLDAALQRETLAFCRAEAGRLDDLDPQARLVHCDFDPNNILLRPTAGDPPRSNGLEVAAVIDWEFALAATPLIDLGHLLRAPQGDVPGLDEALAEGYRRAGGELPADCQAAARLLDLLAWLDFLNRPGDHPRLFQDARQILRETMDRWPQFLD